MQRILLFFIKYNGVFAFFVLQGIALFMYFTRNSNSNKQAFISSANRLVGGVYESTSQITHYWNLSAVNDSLARENAELKMKLPSSKFSSLVHPNEVKDSTLQQHYRYFEAKVINNTIHRPRNFLTINKGTQQGLNPNSGVLNGNGKGIVGVAQKVSNNYAVVMSILNLDTRISAKILRTNNFGIMVWDGLDSRYMTLESVPKHADIHKGDTIVTSGYSTIFPEGILIGAIDSFYKAPGVNFYTIKVALFNDMNRVQYVYVVSNLLKEERIKLEEEVNND
ncbi:rod shape-determining protein MreC [Aureispira anguillae]|uniref:Cell shape-determining protein MreC n=1 Tax=Aureispira anguillae TaxID=2864201 RepID=A0A915YL73_9BACT|nr:rod shape-determining protein MreC [Aureispira anguillae]BDS14808.1 rod shape-determining protein MreC [Aureispira anguillae]